MKFPILILLFIKCIMAQSPVPADDIAHQAPRTIIILGKTPKHAFENAKSYKEHLKATTEDLLIMPADTAFGPILERYGDAMARAVNCPCLKDSQTYDSLPALPEGMESLRNIQKALTVLSYTRSAIRLSKQKPKTQERIESCLSSIPDDVLYALCTLHAFQPFSSLKIGFVFNNQLSWLQHIIGFAKGYTLIPLPETFESFSAYDQKQNGSNTTIHAQPARACYISIAKIFIADHIFTSLTPQKKCVFRKSQPSPLQQWATNFLANLPKTLANKEQVCFDLVCPCDPCARQPVFLIALQVAAFFYISHIVPELRAQQNFHYTIYEPQNTTCAEQITDIDAHIAKLKQSFKKEPINSISHLCWSLPGPAESHPKNLAQQLMVCWPIPNCTPRNHTFSLNDTACILNSIDLLLHSRYPTIALSSFYFNDTSPTTRARLITTQMCLSTFVVYRTDTDRHSLLLTVPNRAVVEGIRSLNQAQKLKLSLDLTAQKIQQCLAQSGAASLAQKAESTRPLSECVDGKVLCNTFLENLVDALVQQYSPTPA